MDIPCLIICLLFGLVSAMRILSLLFVRFPFHSAFISSILCFRSSFSSIFPSGWGLYRVKNCSSNFWGLLKSMFYKQIWFSFHLKLLEFPFSLLTMITAALPWRLNTFLVWIEEAKLMHIIFQLLSSLPDPGGGGAAAPLKYESDVHAHQSMKIGVLGAELCWKKGTFVVDAKHFSLLTPLFPYAQSPPPFFLFFVFISCKMMKKFQKQASSGAVPKS